MPFSLHTFCFCRNQRLFLVRTGEWQDEKLCSGRESRLKNDMWQNICRNVDRSVEMAEMLTHSASPPEHKASVSVQTSQSAGKRLMEDKTLKITWPVMLRNLWGKSLDWLTFCQKHHFMLCDHNILGYSGIFLSAKVRKTWRSVDSFRLQSLWLMQV